LPLLRLCVACGSTPAVVKRLFEYVWVDGHLPTDTQAWGALLSEIGIDATRLDASEVKQALIANTQRAVTLQLFGVPTARCWDDAMDPEGAHAQLFWGFDATDMIEAWLRDDPFFDSDSWAQSRSVSAGIQRKV
jgi:2-hydroxychromene-2-carboxylate isomerase